MKPQHIAKLFTTNIAKLVRNKRSMFLEKEKYTGLYF